MVSEIIFPATWSGASLPRDDCSSRWSEYPSVYREGSIIVIARYESVSIGGEVGALLALMTVGIIALAVVLSVAAGFCLVRRARRH